jgi:hypothetical protein
MLKDYESRSKLGAPGRSDLGLMQDEQAAL